MIPGIPGPPSKAIGQLKHWSIMAGHSRTSIAVGTADGRFWFVRKVATDAATAARLDGQIAKQIAFADTDAARIISVPAILDSGSFEGERYYDMEYVPGQDIASYLRYATYDQVVALTEKLGAYIGIALASRPLLEVDPGQTLFSASYRKLIALSRIAPVMDILREGIIERLFLGLEALREQEVTPTLCHGDFTFENLMVLPNGNLIALDLLDSPFEHVWQDVAKLHQDSLGEWFTIRHPPLSRGVLSFIGRRVQEFTTRVSPGYVGVHPVLVALAFARILPYVKDEHERAFVALRLRTLSERIDPR